MSFDEWAVNNQNFKALSQSLWNRAMSFDVKRAETLDVDLPVSIPLEQGNVFRPSTSALESAVKGVSIPLEQGNVFRH